LHSDPTDGFFVDFWLVMPQQEPSHDMLSDPELDTKSEHLQAWMKALTSKMLLKSGVVVKEMIEMI
jgi:hypothetical protein